MSARRGTAALAVGSAVTGLLAYAVFAVSTRALGAEAAAPVSVLWTWWGFTGAALTFPVQHWVARTVAAHGDAAVAAALPRVAGVVLAIAVGAGGVSWLVREPLFGRTEVWFPLMVIAVAVGSALVGVVRGGLTARGRYAAVGASLVTENALRLVGVGALAVAGVDAPAAYGLCLVGGHLVVLGWPSARRFERGATPPAGSGAFAFLAGAGAAQLTAQAVLTSGPVVVALSGGSPADVTALFAALALFRAPYLLAQGVVAPLTVRLTRLAVTDATAELRRLRRGLGLVTLVGLPLAWAVGRWLGPDLLRWVFGDGVRLAGTLCALLAVGCALAVVNLLAMVDVLAHDRPAVVAGAWAAGTGGGVAVFAASVALAGADPTEATVTAFLAAEVVVLVALVLLRPRVGRVSARA